MGRVRPGKNWKGPCSDYVPLLDNETNRFFAEHDKKFMEACTGAKVAPTKQQASRFKRKHGAAYRYMQEQQTA